MIKTLKKRFIMASMTVVTVLLVILLGVINAINIIMVRGEVTSRLDMIAGAEGNFEFIGKDPMPPERPDSRFEPKGERDKFLASNFFTVKVDDSDRILNVDVSRTTAVDEIEAISYAEKAISSGNDSGKEGKYRYKISDMRDKRGRIAVFLDTSEELYSNLRVLLLSLAAGAGCWLCMLLLAILVSGRAIRPIALNLERQKRFITDAGHEIKTPLAIIRSNTDCLELYTGESKWSRNIKDQTARLDGLMKNMMTLASADESKRKTEPTEVTLDGVVEECARAFCGQLEQKMVMLDLTMEKDITVLTDKVQVTQLLMILLDNAVKYVNDSGKIEVYLSGSRSGCKARLLIRNTCDKLPECSPDKLFDRFYRSDSARTQRTGGYGLGLSIARSIAEANGIALDCKYEGNNTIVFSLMFKS